MASQREKESLLKKRPDKSGDCFASSEGWGDPSFAGEKKEFSSLLHAKINHRDLAPGILDDAGRRAPPAEGVAGGEERKSRFVEIKKKRSQRNAEN